MNCAWSAAVCDCYDAASMHALATRASTLHDSLSLRGAASMMWAMGKLRHRDDRAFGVLAGVVARHARAAEAMPLAAMPASDANGVGAVADYCLVGEQKVDSAGFALPGFAGCQVELIDRNAFSTFADEAERHAQRDTDRALSLRAGTEVGQCLSVAAHACATLGCFQLAAPSKMLTAILAFARTHRSHLGKQSLVNICWAAMVAGRHKERDTMAPLVMHALSRGDELNTLELGQLAQVDLALQLEAEWYRGEEWMEAGDGRVDSLLTSLYWLGSARCASHSKDAIILPRFC